MKTNSREPYQSEPFAPPLDKLSSHSEEVSGLCDLLESMADDLPNQKSEKWRVATVQSLVTVPHYYQIIAHSLLPILIERPEIQTDCLQFLRRLYNDYVDGEASLSELQALLADSEPSKNNNMSPEALGYALRNFFEMIRRQTNWDKDVLLPFAARYLKQIDLEKISAALSEVNITQHPAVRP